MGNDLLAVAGWDGNKSLNDVIQLSVSALIEHLNAQAEAEDNDASHAKESA